MTDIQRERFKHIASKLQELLQERGLSPTVVRPRKNGREGWYSGIARWSKDRPLVLMMSGKWFRDDAQHFWFGFWSANKSAIDELREYRSSTVPGILKILNNTSEGIFSLDDEKSLFDQGGEAQETDSPGSNFFGRYDFSFSDRSDEQLAIEASKFIGEIIERVDPYWDEKQDIAKIKRGGSTEREALVLARRGQGKFRRDVEAIWGDAAQFMVARRGRC